jgi:WD40 repeat protein
LWITSIARVGATDEFVAASADGLLLREADVYSFKANDPTALTKLYSHPAAVWCVASSSDGGTIASVDYRGNLMVHEKGSPGTKLHEKAFERWCQAMLISADDRFVIAGNEAGKVMAWDISANRISNSVELDGHAVTGLALSPDHKQLAASDGGGHVHLLKWPELEPVGKIEVSDESAWCVAYDYGSILLVGSSDRHLYRCEAKPDAKAEVMAKGTDWITELAISPSGQVAAAEVGGHLHFPTRGGSESMQADSGVWALCWNGDGQLFAGTRKNGILIAGQSWKWTEPQPAPVESEPKADAEKPEGDEKKAEEGEQSEQGDEASEGDKPNEEAGKPAAETAAASENEQ